MHLYNYPSTEGEEIVMDDLSIIEKFKNISNHYTCISGYDYENGSFRGKNYKEIIKIISGSDIENKIGHEELLNIYNKLTKLLNVIRGEESIKYYHQKYPFNKHNFPIELNQHYNINSNTNNYYLSSCELEFLQILFGIYSNINNNGNRNGKNITLIPTYKDDFVPPYVTRFLSVKL